MLNSEASTKYCPLLKQNCIGQKCMSWLPQLTVNWSGTGRFAFPVHELVPNSGYCGNPKVLRQ